MDFRAMLMKRKVNNLPKNKIKLCQNLIGICQNPFSNQVKQKKIVVKKIEWLEVSSHLADCKTDQEKEKINWTFFQGYCENESDCWNLDYTENGGSFWGVRLWSG